MRCRPSAGCISTASRTACSGWRIAYSPDLGYAKVDPEIAACVAEAAQRFEELGAHVEQVGAIFDSPRQALLTLWAAGAARVMAGVSATTSIGSPIPG